MSRLNVGGALHVLSGSVQRGARRLFAENDTYYDMEQTNRFSQSGFGVSAGVLFTPIPEVRLAASYRNDTELKSTVDQTEVGRVDLPVSYSGGVFLRIHPSIRLATTLERHLWSSADSDLEAVGGANAYDTWSIGSGLELGGSSGIPLRLGVRHETLPFSPSAEQASEFSISAGSALIFAAGRASLEASVERISRNGAGAEERAWFLMFALTVTP
jgi:long-subunit fatty acid transport protein